MYGITECVSDSGVWQHDTMALWRKIIKIMYIFIKSIIVSNAWKSQMFRHLHKAPKAKSKCSEEGARDGEH